MSVSIIRNPGTTIELDLIEFLSLFRGFLKHIDITLGDSIWTMKIDDSKYDGRLLYAIKSGLRGWGVIGVDIT